MISIANLVTAVNGFAIEINEQQNIFFQQNADSNQITIYINENDLQISNQILIPQKDILLKKSLNSSDFYLSRSESKFFLVDTLGLLLKAGNEFDFESQSSFSIPIQIEAKSLFESTISDTILVLINDLAEAPRIEMISSINEIYENTTDTVLIAQISITDPDSLGIDDIQLSANSQNLQKDIDFSYLDQTIYLYPTLRVKSLYNYELNQKISFNIVATDSSNLSSSYAFEISLLDVPEAPKKILIDPIEIDENPLNGQILTKLTVVDEDFDERHQLILLNEDPSLFVRKTNNTFELVVSDSSTFNFEAIREFYVDLVVLDKDSLSLLESFKIAINNVNEAPFLSLTDTLLQAQEDQIAITRLFVEDPESLNSELFYEFKSSNPYLIQSLGISMIPADSLIYRLVFDPLPNANGQAIVTVSTRDSEYVVSSDLRINFKSINDPAQIKIKPLNILEGSTQIIDEQHIKVSDIDNFLTEISIKIEMLPDHGSLIFNNSVIAKTPFSIDAIDLYNGHLSYHHDGSETRKDNFEFSILEQLERTSKHHFPIHIKPVNDKPLFVNRFFPIYLNEDEQISIGFSVYDEDNNYKDISSSAISLNEDLISSNGLHIDGSDKIRSLKINPINNAYGRGQIRLILHDGIDSTFSDIDVFVSPVNDPPSFELSSSTFKIDARTFNHILIPYNDPDTKPEKITLSYGSFDTSFIDDNSIEISQLADQSAFQLSLSTRNFYRMYESIGELILELSDEESAKAQKITLELADSNFAPSDFQLIRATPELSNDSLSIFFEWEQSIDTDGDEVFYSVHIKSAEFDTSFKQIQSTYFRLTDASFLQPNTRYNWWVTSTDHSFSKQKMDAISTESQNEGQFFTPNFNPAIEWIEIESTYPNPFRLSTQINFSLKEDATIELSIFDLSGRKIDTIEQGFKQNGVYVYNWTPYNLNTGVYICRLIARKITDGTTLIKTKNLTYLP